MTSLLEGALRKRVAQGFKGRLLKGQLRLTTPTTQNSLGDPVPGTTTTFTFEGIRDNFDASYAARANIPLTDVKVLIILGSVKPVLTQDQEQHLQNFQVFIVNKWHTVRRVLKIDPARASAELQCYESPAP